MAKQPADSTADRTDAPSILVIGSINMDLVVRTSQIPLPGQTVAGHSFATIAGGKGANQAVAAARCGAKVSMIGRVGNDDFGQRLLLGLKANGVDVSAVCVSEGVATSTATIMVDDCGENAICVAGDANQLLSSDDIDEHTELLDQADVIVTQLEIPQQTVVDVLHEARRRNKPVVLNPAPVPEDINPALFDADVIIPNQDETACLCGEPATDIHSAKLAASALVARGAKTVIVTLGRRGAIALTAEQMFHVPSFDAGIVDTTGAGDAFCGAFAVAFAEHKNLQEATRFATAAGSLACRKFGAQPSMPHRDAVLRLLRRSC